MPYPSYAQAMDRPGTVFFVDDHQRGGAAVVTTLALYHDPSPFTRHTLTHPDLSHGAHQPRVAHTTAVLRTRTPGKPAGRGQGCGRDRARASDGHHVDSIRVDVACDDTVASVPTSITQNRTFAFWSRLLAHRTPTRHRDRVRVDGDRPLGYSRSFVRAGPSGLLTKASEFSARAARSRGPT